MLNVLILKIQKYFAILYNLFENFDIRIIKYCNSIIAI